jgi:Flp pilus assembly protein TadD
MMMRTPALLAAAAALLSACAANQSAGLVENGYSPGSLAVAAIDRGDWAQAEALLTRNGGASQDDPARLINLGKVYMETGRPGMALSAWRKALASDRHEMVETIGGQWVSTEALARQALALHGTEVRSAAR